jgi:hypothetical protein
VVWQSAIGTRIHATDERGDRASYVALVEVIEGSLLALLDVFLARHVNCQGSIHFRHPQNLLEKSADQFERRALIRLLERRQTKFFDPVWELGH